jgi:hypothetical protein
MRIILLLIIVFQINQVCSAQSLSKFDFFVGYGFYEGYTIGSEYFFNSKNNSASLSLGYDRLKKRQQESVSLSLGYNFSIFRSYKNNSNEFKWHLNNKAVFWQLDDEYYLWRTVSLIPSINRTFLLYKDVKLSFDIGPSFNIVVFNKRKTYREVGWPYQVMPDFRILLIL